jgi:hypothetical protein
MAADVAITFYKGENVVRNFQQFVDGTTTPDSIVNWTILLTVKPSPTYPSALLTKLATIVNAASGRYQFHLTHAETVALRAGSYYCDIQRTDPGSEFTMAVGRLTVLQECLYP